MKSRIPQTGTTCLPYTLHSCQTRPKQGIAIMDDRAAFFHTLVPTPGVQSRRRRQACQLVNASTPSRAPRCRRAWIPAGDLRQDPRRAPPQRPRLARRAGAPGGRIAPPPSWRTRLNPAHPVISCGPARRRLAGRGACANRPGKPPHSRGMGHVRVACNSCHDQLRQTVFFEPPHDRGHRRLTVWVTEPCPRR